MKIRRNLLQIATLGLFGSILPGKSRAATMKTIALDGWTFEVPSDWQRPEDEDNKSMHLEAPDQSMGCYVKTIHFAQLQPSAETAASSIQAIHERNFTQLPNTKWKVMQRSSKSAGPLVHSNLDMFDQGNKYRVQSVVVATAEMASRFPYMTTCAKIMRLPCERWRRLRNQCVVR